jgi:hypothetical protein
MAGGPVGGNAQQMIVERDSMIQEVALMLQI